MSRRWMVLFAFSSAACELSPGGPPRDLAGLVSFDGGAPDSFTGVDLGGNHLALDGGTGLGALWFTVTDNDTGLPTPSRVIFRPPPGAGFADSITMGTPDPKSPGSATGAVVAPGVLGSPEGVLLVSGQGVVPVPPGSYQLFITRGPEYEAIQTQVTVTAGSAQAVSAQLHRSVDTRGWLAADMHVHSSRSGDSKLAGDRRVISMVSSGIEIIVPTDHNVNTDLAPTIAALGYGGDVVGTVVGNEFNFKEGHAGAYPVPFSATAPNGGAPPWQAYNQTTMACDAPVVGINCFDSGSAFGMMHQQVPGATVVTINHPWWITADLGYFTNIHWGAGTTGGFQPLATAGQFDALEVLNGYWTRTDAESSLVADWFYLLGQGVRLTALGNSDTHKINWVRAGFPRTWLRLANDRPGDTTGAALAEAVRKSRAVASTGPFLTFTVDGAQIGDLMVPLAAGQVQVAITVDAPDWIPVDTVRMYKNGALAHSFSVPAAGQRPVFQTTLTESITTDSWIVVVASGAQPLPPDVVGEYSHVNGWEMTPIAIANPVFIDANGDGVWAPPPSPATTGAPGLRPLPAADERLVVPVDCEPFSRYEEEPVPPAERLLMPLLYP